MVMSIHSQKCTFILPLVIDNASFFILSVDREGVFTHTKIINKEVHPTNQIYSLITALPLTFNGGLFVVTLSHYFHVLLW